MRSAINVWATEAKRVGSALVMKPRVHCYRVAFFPSGKFEAVPAVVVQQTMRGWFEQWGRPSQIQFDHGPPWYSTQGRMPTLMELWLVGLGIEVVWSRPRRPQDNGIVERSHRTSQSWSAPSYCRDLKHLQDSLDAATQVQWQLYPNRTGTTRVQRYPQLLHRPRPYQAHLEDELWSISLVHEHLAKQQWQRKVGKTGQISLYNRPYRVGTKHASQTLWIRFDASNSEWVCREQSGQEVKRFQSLEINPTVIRQLLFHRPSSGRNSRKTLS